MAILAGPGAMCTSAAVSAAAVDRHAASQAIEIVGVGHAQHLGLVHARDTVARMRQARGEVAVVGQDQQPFGIEVEPADRIDVLADAGRADRSRSAAAPDPIAS